MKERGEINMSIFNRYCIHFSIFGLIFLIGAIVLIVVDGGELLKPIILMSIIFADVSFVFLMSLLFCSFAKPIKLNLKVNNKTEFLEQLNKMSEKKWGRKQIEQVDDKLCYRFGNKYKDWLVTPMEISFDDNICSILVPSYYQEEIYKLNNN